MQVYASYKYPRTNLENLRPGKFLQQATDLHPSMLSSDMGEDRRVDPFDMKPATLIRLAHHLHTHASGMLTTAPDSGLLVG